MLKQITRYLTVITFLLVLSACGSSAAAPEEIATRRVFEKAGNVIQIYEETVEVQQSVALNEKTVLVVLTFQGYERDMGEVNCFQNYEMVKGTFGWQPGASSGTCQEKKADFKPGEDIQFVGESSEGRGPQDLGYSMVSGYVFNPEIVKVRVTWSDNVVNEVEVVNGTVVVVRPGSASMKRLQGLDDQGDVLYSNYSKENPGVHP